MTEKARGFGETIGKVTTNVIYIDSNRDGKISRTEILSFITAIALEGIQSFDDIPAAIEELKTEGSAARTAFVEGIKKEFDLINDTVEFLIEDWLEWLEKGITLGERTGKVLRPQNAKV